MSAQEFRLPDVGEGLTEAEIVKWHVAVGDTVALNDVLVEIETAKSVVELPSPFAGTVVALLAEEGQTVAVGSAVVTIGDAPADPEPEAETKPEAGAETKPAVLVGYGPSDAGRTSRRRPAPAAGATAPPGKPTAALAKPPVRKLAKDLGVDITALTPSGPGGTVTREDIRRHADADRVQGAPAGEVVVTRIPVKGVRKATAAAMSASAFTAPHVTEFLTVDVTRSVRLVDRLGKDPSFREHKVTMLLLVARALVIAAREFPEINTSWDGEAGEIVLHRDVNLGIAAATPRGLLVPNIKNAGGLSLPGLAAALTGLVRTAREGRTTPEDMSGGTITITNIGVFGMDTGTPILNPGEAAILCLGAVRRTPWEHKGKVALRWTTQLALSFDHRLVDGELGSRVLARVGRILSDPEWQLILA
ncbi:dihydrolipoamide acetyltransferase family protein [Actinomadura madurae]|uniref:dihydrolipoamide acetyltransferase family protein n=1 Tax=Actinomadura madurae TaxID=1993 RepID=UPI0020D22002|nr:dihydrolipoamide acetyltransferase family protein [Actinomadura madurae]MCP9955710.1 2-oxo acid dehydrogenase subunit E2 [Actinomadura madurae]MCP9972442.1 2-oxo acid dehydrogenase subunit E2 [Actinomadura madurae]MCP9984954.1 2-oxo acid dehydrogenase subunit E2 [Actinomadura madurae]MCQ0003486.1 2-oxo acid dehydrogenase subunit E2 [Actinomadura madurae]MCQ0021152.1 2-oxo acid dehydrogenase subunit E2 [Actinomadura madurae]